MTEQEQKKLANNIVNSMCGIIGEKKTEIAHRTLCHLFREDIQLGTIVAQGLGVPIHPQTMSHEEAEKELNSNILKITMKIKDQFPELSKYIEEMPVTIPDEKHPEITLVNLKSYYDSLNSILNKYILEHPDHTKPEIDKNA